MTELVIDHSAEYFTPPDKDGIFIVQSILYTVESNIPSAAGWAIAHRSLVAHMSELQRGFKAFAKQLADGKCLEDAQKDAVKCFWKTFEDFLHHHHDNEEKIAIPYMKTRVLIPEKISVEHTELIELLDECGVLLTTILETHDPYEALATFDELRAKFKSLTDLSISHFEEEEKELLIELRKAFTPTEVKKNISDKILQGAPLSAHAPFFRPLSKRERQEFYAAEKMPFFVPWLINFTVHRHSKRVYMPYINAVMDVESSYHEVETTQDVPTPDNACHH